MDLSINNLNSTNKKVNFKGLEGSYDKKSTPVYKFIAPPHKSNEIVTLQFTPLYEDEKTAGFQAPKKEKLIEIKFNHDDTLEIPQDFVRGLSSGFAYRYKITDKKGSVRYELDPFKQIGMQNAKDGKLNVIEQGKFYGITPKGGTMRHSFLDSDVRLDKSGEMVTERNKEFVRNHFNKLGGSVAGLLYLLRHDKEELAPYRYLMTTPDIGADKISSHKYWPSNQYQCTDLNTFKDFNFELFKQGKGYIADGAFTSQGIQSPLVQHVLKWGEESPFYNMLKIDGDIALGILPDLGKREGENPYKHIGVRIVNPKGENYDKNKATYVQFYDDRLLTAESQKDGRMHFTYDKAPSDSYEITSHQDSVQPYAFEIDPHGARARIFENGNAVLLKDIKNAEDFLNFPHFRITTKNNVAGVTCWDGNVDIIKMNLSNPTVKPENRQGFYDAREYILGVATYWTEAIQSDLILQTAKSSEKEREAIAEANGVSKDEIESSLDSFDSIVLKQNKTPSDYLQEFKLQSLETSEELSAIFSEPQFNSELFDKEYQEKVLALLNETINGVIPNDKKDSEEYKTYVTKTYANEILRNIFAYSLNPDAVKNGVIDLKKLKEVTLPSMEIFSSLSPFEERKQVINKMRKNFRSNPQNAVKSVKEKISKELKNISLDDFKMAEAIVLQGKGGLNWRFDAAKDIGDMDAIKDGSKTFDQIWNGDEQTPGLQPFWGDFVSRIRTYNPASYVINEVTCLGDFYKWNDKDSMKNFDKKLAEAFSNLSPEEQEQWENHVPYAKQVDFLNRTNSTTTSEYAKGFNAFSEFIGVDPEHGNKDVKNNAGKLENLKSRMDTLMYFNQPNSAIFSHMFTNNHDKPSILHTLPLNMPLYLTKDLETVDDETKSQIEKLTGRTDFKHMSAQAVAVGLAMQKVIDSSDYSDEKKAKLTQSLQNLVNGKKTDDSEPTFKRAQSFGVKPYEVTVLDLFKNSGLKYDEDDVLDFHKNLLNDAMILYSRLWEVMNACVGTPALYGGNEFAQTGYETPSKNVYLGIRNEVLHGLKDDKRYKEYYEKISETSGLYKRPGLSALRDGTPVSMRIVKDGTSIDEQIEGLAFEANINKGALNYFADKVVEYLDNHNEDDAMDNLFDRLDKSKARKGLFDVIIQQELGINPSENQNGQNFKNSLPQVAKAVELKLSQKNIPEFEMWPIYKKDSKGSEVLSIITNLGIPQNNESHQYQASQNVRHSVPKIELRDDKNLCPFEDGTILKRVGDKKQYVVQWGFIASANGEPIELTDTVTTFYVDKSVNPRFRIV